MDEHVKTTEEQYKANLIHNLLTELATMANYVATGNPHYIVSQFGTKTMSLIIQKLFELTEASK